MSVTWAIGLVIGMSSLHYAVMGYGGYDPSTEAEAIMSFSLILLFAWWASDDAKKQNFHRPYEFGAFIFLVWPIVLPAYLVATRGWKGIFLFPIFIGLFYAPWLVGWVAYFISPSSS